MTDDAGHVTCRHLTHHSRVSHHNRCKGALRGFRVVQEGVKVGVHRVIRGVYAGCVGGNWGGI